MADVILLCVGTNNYETIIGHRKLIAIFVL